MKNLLLVHRNKTNSMLNKISEIYGNILIFDSGIGGISVYSEIHRILPNFCYIYVFDNLAFPYSEKTEKFIINRVIKIFNTVQRYYKLFLAIIACNTASVISLLELRKRFRFPIIGVLPAIKTGTSLTKDGTIGLLATQGTVKHPFTCSLIKKFAKNYQFKVIGSTEMVLLAESKFRGEDISLELIERILLPWLQKEKIPKTVILGCTHFQFLRNEIQSLMPRKTLLFEPSKNIAYRVLFLLNYYLLIKKKYLCKNHIAKNNKVYCTILTSEVKRLLPVLNIHGFKTLEELYLN